MRAYIKKIQAKDEDKRKQIFVGAMIGSMTIVTFIWIYGLGVRFTSPNNNQQANADIKPFKLFSNSVSDTFNSISASVAKAPKLKNVKQEINSDSQKQVDLIPVENSNQ